MTNLLVIFNFSGVKKLIFSFQVSPYMSSIFPDIKFSFVVCCFLGESYSSKLPKEKLCGLLIATAADGGGYANRGGGVGDMMGCGGGGS